MNRPRIAPRSHWLRLLLCALPALLASGWARGDEPAGGAALFQERIAPILTRNCLSCHSGDQPKGGLNLTSREGALQGGESGPAIDLDTPADSLLLLAVNYDGFEMPPKGKLAPETIAQLTEWVRAGAPWGEKLADVAAEHGPEVNDEARRFWSFQPVRRPPLPAVRDSQWSTQPLDRFVLARLEAAELAPNDEARPEEWLRRVHYDLTGLPPTPEESRRFLEELAEERQQRANGAAPQGPGAYERLVDRLLDSPHYGEHWGRHWLDLVRFAETNSYERDGEKPNAWRYRDYVIRSFNDDKPYDEFLIEQLAGDEVAPATPDRLIATGYYRLGLWDDEPVDAIQAHFDDLDDVVSTTCQVMLGLSMNCARCHGHKLDPLPHRDYYRMLAFFAGVNRYGGPPRYAKVAGADNYFGGRDVGYSLRPLGSAEEIARSQAEIAEHQARLQEVEARLNKLDEAIRPRLPGGDRDDFKDERSRPAVVRRLVPSVFSEQEAEEYAAVFRERQRVRRSAPTALDQALCVTEAAETPETFVLLRGSAHSHGDPVEPGFPEVLGFPDPTIERPAAGTSSGRRLALANWIASPANPLTARVWANRVWHYHFGRGIVRSTSDFGTHGDPPTHPELLDWLAAELVEGGWRLKRLHKLIVLSATYRQSSRARPDALERDPRNDLLGRFDLRRLTAEELRDSILVANGSLNRKLGGHSVYPKIPAEILAGQSRPGEGWGQSSPEDRCRRSVYIFVKRSLPLPLIASFDGPETDFSCPVRSSTTQPTQALALFNGEFLREEATLLAQAAVAESDATHRPVERVLWRCLQRPPTDAEVARGEQLIDKLVADGATPELALRDFCLVALNLDEFIYVP